MNAPQAPQRPMPEYMGKTPPHDTGLERALLGALMLEPAAVYDAAPLLCPEAFYEPAHRLIYAAISALAAARSPVDMLTVIEQLRRDGALDKAGGPAAVAQLCAEVSSAAHASFHARVIADKFMARELIRAGGDLVRDAFDPGRDPADTLSAAEAALFALSRRADGGGTASPIGSFVGTVLEKAQKAANAGGGVSGTPCGIRALDKATCGWQDTDLVIIAARPAMGKTALALTMAKNMAVGAGLPTAFFSLEMSAVQLTARVMANVCEVESERLRAGDLRDDEWHRLNARSNALFGAPLFIDETPALPVASLRSRARALVRDKGVKIIMVDYLQLMAGGAGLRFGSREQEVCYISRSLKALAKELKVPVIALSQLNRSVEGREDKRPVLSDLRESGAIEQDADFVAFIHRPEYYLKDDSGHDKDGRDVRGLAEIIIAKNRAGACRTVPTRFTGRYVRFEDWDNNAIIPTTPPPPQTDTAPPF